MAKYITEISKNGNIAVDDTILVKGYPATAGSKMLENFVPLFTATAVEKLTAAGYTLSGKTAVGEFGLDLYGETSENETCAAATLVANGEVKAALSVDLNGAPRRAASIKGVTFVKPTYGTVSRYGVIACACSGEQIGVTAKNADTAAEVLGVVSGFDSKDGTSLKTEKYEYNTGLSVKGKKVAVIKELLNLATNEAKVKLLDTAEQLKKQGVEVEEISLPLVKEIQTAWNILMSAETTNNLSRFDGVKYGHRTEKYKNIDELYVGSRTEGFNFLTKATIIYGSDVLSKGKYEVCYDKALKIRKLAVDSLTELFEKNGFTALLVPAFSQTKELEVSTAKTLDGEEFAEQFRTVFEESAYTAPASITGMPAVVSGGIQLVGNYFAESELLSFAKVLEKEEA